SFERVGSSSTIHVDVRVLATSNRDLRAEIADGNFREDLYYRLAVVPLEVPPLRERRSDIPQLATFFLSRCARKIGKPVEGISQASTESLKRYSWPGNVRELQNF